MSFEYYQQYRFGSAGAASFHDLKRAGLVNGQGISFGFDQTKRHELRSSTDGSVALFAGAGSGKSASAFANSLIGGHIPHNFICFDPRGELAAVSMLALSLQGYALYFVNPTGMLGLPHHCHNALGHLSLGSESLIADVQKAALDLCPTPAGARTSWTYDDARRWVSDLLLYDTERNGYASLPSLFELLQAIQGDIDIWCSHLDAMMDSRFPSVCNFAGEIMALQKEGKESFTAPLGLLSSKLAFLRDPHLQESLSGADFSLQDLTHPDKKIGVFVIWPITYLQTQSTAIRQIFGAVIQNKMRHPSPVPVSILFDEAGQVGNFPSIRELFTFGRGAGLVSNMVAWQEISQIKAGFGAEADEIIGSAQYRVFKGVRTMASAQMVASMAGTMTLSYDATNEQSNAKRLKQQAALKMLSGGGFFESAANLHHYKQAEFHQSKQAREILRPDEVLNMPPSMMVAFASGLVDGPILGHWINHFERRDFAGKYLNNPYHGEQVSIKTWWGKKAASVVEESVPDALAHLPQYKGGTWRYVEGCRPNLR